MAAIPGIDAHVRQDLAAAVECHAGLEGHFIEFPLAVIMEKEILLDVVADEDVRVAVVVVIDRDHAHAAAGMRGDPRFPAHVGEGAVAVVPVERIGHGLVLAGRGV